MAHASRVRVRSAELLKSVRIDAGLSQSSIAAVAGCSRQSVSLWEHGTSRVIAYDRAKHVADRLGVTVPMLFSADGP